MTSEALENWLISALQQSNDKHKSLDELSLLTVVIPSYGRQDFLLRQCAYWHGRGAVLIIVDGSPKPLGERVQHILRDLDDVRYLHSPVSMIDRLKQASNLVRTRYTVMLGDDDIFLFSGLCSAINQLEKNHDLVACVGQSLHYYLSNNGSKFSYGKGYNTYKYEIKHDTVEDRLNSSMKDYTPATCSAVIRSSIWRKSWGGLQPFSSPFAWELEQAFITYISGKLGTVDDVYWMRSSENPPTNTNDCDRYLSIDEWWISNKFKTERVCFIEKLSDELISSQNIDRAAAEIIVRNAVDAYLQNIYQIGNSSLRQKCRRFLVSAVIKYLPHRWVGYMKRLKSSLNPTTPKALAAEDFGSLADLKVTETPLPFRLSDEFFADLSDMEKLIADFYSFRSVQSK